MLNPFQLLDPWMMIGGAALLLQIFLAVFVWNSPRRREPSASSRTPGLVRMAPTTAAPDGFQHPRDGRAIRVPQAAAKVILLPRSAD